MSKYTPGPWNVENGCEVFSELGATNRSGVTCDSDDGWQIADCMAGKTFVNGELVGDLEYSEQRANAQLISAAPDMLEALQGLLEIQHATKHGFEQRQKARAAIAKALGDNLMEGGK